jgi:hypothetical protein
MYTIHFSDIISVISLAVSIYAVREARNNRNLNYRSLKSDKLDRYGRELHNIKECTEEPIDQLRHEAFMSFDKIGKYIDNYSGGATGGRPARHILYDLCSAFFDDLIFKVGLNSPFLWHKLEVINRIDDPTAFFRPNEQMLRAYEILQTAIPESERQAVVDTALDLSNEYRSIHKGLMSLLQENIEKIDLFIKENEYEEFKIDESDAGKKLIVEKNKYQEILELGLMDSEKFIMNSKNKPENWQLNETIYIAVVLYIVSQYNHWGLYR